MDLRRTKTKLAESIFSNVENYFSAQPADNRLAIVENLAFTKKIANGVCETTDTACPVNIKSSALKRERRFPDAIGIGAAKCGTGSLMFLDCHPNIVFRDQEARSGTVVHKCILRLNNWAVYPLEGNTLQTVTTVSYALKSLAWKTARWLDEASDLTVEETALIIGIVCLLKDSVIKKHHFRCINSSKRKCARRCAIL